MSAGYVDMVWHIVMRFRRDYSVPFSSLSYFTYQRGLLRCLSLLGRQCEGLGTWDKQQVQIPTSFHFKQYIKPLGSGNLREMALMM